ncbi:MAG: SMP-30/gluconolactonase/LRE family protein [Flavobacteriaceae bacterium]|nr:SMP-30/gluconolactonase/LRE family protein [Flavobacteriaceae bacterium]
MKSLKAVSLVILIFLLFQISFLNCSQSNTETTATLELKNDALLGEGALWNYKTQELYWVDIVGMKFHIYNPKTQTNKSYNMPTMIGTVVPLNDYYCLVALADNIYKLNLDTEELLPFSDVELTKEENRFNDGKCDPNGNLWAGTINLDNPKKCKLYKINNEGESEIMIDSITNSNGIVWSKDAKTMFYIDSPSKQIKAYDFNNATSTISNERILVEVEDSFGILDGMAIDENDNLWVGLWDGFAVANFNSKTGELIRKIKVPAKNVTSCAFGGENLDILYITTSSLGMTEEEQKRYPNAGSLFKVKPGVKGVNTTHFKLD